MSDTQTETIASWLLAQIAADEANAATVRIEVPPLTNPDGSWQTVPGRPKEADQHVLTVCAAHRAIVELHSAGVDPEHGCAPRFSGNPWWDDADPCPTLRALASAYTDRDGFREEWRNDEAAPNPKAEGG